MDKTGKLTEEEQLSRLMRKVRVKGNCMLWIGSYNGKGYGQIYIQGKRYYTHRLAYELSKGEIPEGKVIDHRCRKPPCVNPIHLRAITQKENVLCGDTIPAGNAARDYCDHGHRFAPDNIVMKKDGDKEYRSCRACRDIRAEDYYYRNQKKLCKKARAKYRRINHD